MQYDPDKKRRGVLEEYLQGYSFHRAPKTLQEAVKTFTGYLREAPKTVHCGSSHTSPEQLPEGRLRESFPTEPQMSLPSWALLGLRPLLAGLPTLSHSLLQPSRSTS